MTASTPTLAGPALPGHAQRASPKSDTLPHTVPIALDRLDGGKTSLASSSLDRIDAEQRIIGESVFEALLGVAGVGEVAPIEVPTSSVARAAWPGQRREPRKRKGPK